MSTAPRIYTVDQDHAIGCWNNVFIAVWRRNPSAERLRNLRTLAQRFMRETNGPVFAAIVVEEKCAVPDDAGRNHSVAFIGDLRERGLGIVLVFEGAGFMAAASRAVMVGLMSTAKFAIPYKVLSTVTQAETFFESKDQKAPPRGALVDAVEALRARISEATSDKQI